MDARRTSGLYSSETEGRAQREVIAKITASGDAIALAEYFRDEHDAYLAYHGTRGKYLSPDERAMVDAVITAGEGGKNG